MAIYASRLKQREYSEPGGSSISSPKAWTDFCTSGTSASLEPFFSEDESSVTAYFIVQLTANVEYTMSYGSSMDERSLELKNLSGTTLASQTADYDEETGDYIDIPIKYTPASTDLFIVYASSYGYDTLNISPRPPSYTNAGWTPWETSSGFKEPPVCALDRFCSTNAAGIGAGFPKKGLVFHTSFASLTKAETGETMEVIGTTLWDGNGGSAVRGAVINTVVDGNRCAHFNDAYINVPSWTDNIVGAAPRTLSFWMKTSVGNDARIVYFGGQSGSGSCFTLIIPNGELYFQGNSRDFGTGVKVNDNKWHHCVATYDGVTVKVYIDEVMKASQNLVLNTDNNQVLKIGADYWGENKYVGYLGALRIYNRILTDEEMKYLSMELHR